MEMPGEFIHRRTRIHKQDCPVHPFRYNLPGKLKPFLSGGPVNMEMAFVQFHTAKIEGHSRRPSSAVRFYMGGVGINCPDQRGFSRAKRTKNDDLLFNRFRH